MRIGHLTNPQKAKGDRAELEVQAILQDELGLGRRALGAGRKDDCGDIHGIPDTIIQVANYASLDRAVREKLPTVEQQMENAGAQYGSLWCRRRGGSFVVVLTTDQYLKLWRESQPSNQQQSPLQGMED